MNREEALNGTPAIEHYKGAAVFRLIHAIYDDFESRICENCKHLQNGECSIINDWDCYNDSPAQWMPPKDFGCNKYEKS